MPYKDPEKERERQRNRRKTTKYKEYQKKYQQEWRAKNLDKWKDIRKKSESSLKRKAYLSNWWKTSLKAKEIKMRFKEKLKQHKKLERWKDPKRKAYLRHWYRTSPKAKLLRQKYLGSNNKKEANKRYAKKHPDIIKKKYARYYNSIKGTLNYLKKNERRKFKIEPKDVTIDLITTVNKRDKNCVYCGIKLPEKPTNRNDVHYDHINPFKPFSETNMVRCCGSCNHQKSNADVLQWCQFKGYKPAKIVYILLKKNKEETN